MPSATDRRSVVNALIGVAVVTALILPAALSWYSPADGPARAPVGAEPPVEPSTTATTPSTAVNWSWSEFSTTVDAVAVHDGRFFAAARDVVLASADGRDWVEVGRLPSGSVVEEMVSFDGTLIARGDNFVEHPDGGRDATGSLWVSSDNGGSWNSVLVGEMIRDVASAPKEVVAVGWIDKGPVGDREVAQAAVWSSVDGQEWSLAWTVDDEAGQSSQADAAYWHDGLVIIGDQGPHSFTEGAGVINDPPWEKVVWTGTTAAELSLSGAATIGGYFEDMVTTELGHFASTFSIDPAKKNSTAIWRSDDALEWDPVEINTGAWSFEHVAGDGHTLIVVAAAYDGSGRQGIWLSRDGVEWFPIDMDGLPKVYLGSLAVSDDVFVITGISGSDAVTGYLITGRIVR